MNNHRLGRPLLANALSLLAIAGCSAGAGGTSAANNQTGNNVGGGGGTEQTNGGSGSGFVVPDAGLSGGAATQLPQTWPPKECVSVITENPDAGNHSGTGAYCQGPAVTGNTTTTNTIQNSSGCGTVLWGIARDFIGWDRPASAAPPGSPHADFGSHYCCGNPLGTVLSTLGTDNKPVYNPANLAGDYSTNGGPPYGVGLTGPTEFDQWYRDTPGVNLSVLVAFDLVPSGDGKTSIFASQLYFPVDNAGFGNWYLDSWGNKQYDYGEDSKAHNFGFTTELHTKFKYQGGETFSFFGDDDVWVFINKKLAVDLGGIHSQMKGSVDLDAKATELGLTIGQVYSMDLFQAERHPAGSNFQITTSMTFVDCGLNPTMVN